MPLSNEDKRILRELGNQIARIGHLPLQKEKADLWRRLNRLERVRPLVWINEVCWYEMNVNDELTPRTTDPLCRQIEDSLRTTLYQWNHFRCDMVVDPKVICDYVIGDTGFGVQANAVRPEGGFVAVDFVPVITSEADVEKIQFPAVTVDWQATQRKYQTMCEIFDGVLPVEKAGVTWTWHAPWDVLIQWYGITELYTDMMDRPQLVHKAVGRMTDALLHRLDQHEKLGALTVSNGNHRVGSGGLGITDELPQKDYDGVHARPIDQWGSSTGQIFSEVSPAMHDEFCLQYELKILRRYGLNCYGCCEPLHNKIDILRQIPRLRRLSMSPWVNVDLAGERMGKEFVFSHKPNPAVLAMDHWNGDLAADNLRKVLDRTRNNVVEVILKDISTVRNQPRRLWEWADIAMNVAQEY